VGGIVPLSSSSSLEPLRSMPDKRQRRKFEQKAAKETKAHGGLGFRDGYSVGPSATLRFSNRRRCFRGVAQTQEPVSACLYRAPISCAFARRDRQPSQLPVRGARERIGEFCVSESARLPWWPLGRAPPDLRHATAFGESAKTMRTIGEAPKALPDDHDGDPAPDSPLFPLLPSVQILFAAFCCIDRSASQSRHSNTSPI
jgi:hypothetical protein